jgi:hemoglobin
VDAPLILTEEQLTDVVGWFYARVRKDPLLGPVFDDAVHDWNRHLHKLVAFWASVMNGAGRYHGSPTQAHAAHADRIKPEMFDRWLALWRETTSEVLPAPAATAMQDRAARMAVALQRSLRRA